MAEKKRRYTRSASQWKQVSKCGEAFALSRGFKGPRPPKRPWAQTVGGSAFHRMIVEWERSERSESPLSLFNLFWDEELKDAKEEQPNLDLWMRAPRVKSGEASLDSVYKRFTEKDVPQYIQRCEEAGWEVLKLPGGDPALELEFELELDGVPVRGTVDRIQWWPKEKMVAVEDTKTGSPEDDDYDFRQLGLYRLGVAEEYDIDLTHGRYWFTKVDRGSRWVDLSRYTADYLTAEFKKVDTIIDQRLFLATPGRGCKLCDVQPWCSELGWLKPGEEL